MEGCTFGTFFGYLFTEHAALAVIGILLESLVIILAIIELIHRGRDSAALHSARDLLHRYAGGVQMAKSVPAVAENTNLVAQLDDLGQHYQNWKKRWDTKH
jgi:hypothetical protein